MKSKNLLLCTCFEALESRDKIRRDNEGFDTFDDLR